MDNFARAQASYDAQMPPEPDECPECDGAEYAESEQDCPHGFYRLASYQRDEALNNHAKRQARRGA